jgi:hypothetical protein
LNSSELELRTASAEDAGIGCGDHLAVSPPQFVAVAGLADTRFGHVAGGLGIPVDDLHGRGSSGLPPLPRDDRERYGSQHGDQQMPVAERPVDDRDHAKQREDRVAQVPAVHSTILAIPLPGMITMSRSTGAPAICRSPPLWRICARGEAEAVGDPADVRAL